ncbi:MAG: exodeoxyribonuclease VII large subunit [Myxococcota bacterium]
MSESAPRVHRVGELLSGVNQLLEDRVGRLWVVGEIKDLRRPASGHLYFSLADESCRLRAALFRGDARRLAFEPEDGMEVLCYGDLGVYAQRGDLQLVVRQLEPRGRGALQLAFEQLRRRLEAEGLFDPARKRPLPERPQRVAVVTSASGAALRDVIEVSGRRSPSTPLLLASTRVQGVGAEDEIAAALDAVTKRPAVDVVLLVRGGGSLEDLQPFNTEVVARAVARSPVPVVAGVGHEVDVSIADLVADVRAPTPSAAAELALPDRALLRHGVEQRWRRLSAAVRDVLDDADARLALVRASLRANAPAARLRVFRERWSAAQRALWRVGRGQLAREGARVAALAGRLESLSPLAVLSRGYGLVRRLADGGIVREPADAPVGEALAVRVASARLEVRVESVEASGDLEKPL